MKNSKNYLTPEQWNKLGKQEQKDLFNESISNYRLDSIKFHKNN